MLGSNTLRRWFGFMIASMRPQPLDLFDDPVLAALGDRIAVAGLSLWLTEETSDLGVPAFRAVIGERFKHFLFGTEVIVERAGREIGAANDVAHGCGFVAQFHEHAARRIENGLPVGRLRTLAFAALICGEDVRVHGAGRTDAGVHARGQVAPRLARIVLTHFHVRLALGQLAMIASDTSRAETEP